MKYDFNPEGARRLAPKLVTAVLDGALIIYPTETIYALGCLATNQTAIGRLFAVKGRAPDQPPPVLIGSMEQLQLLVERMPESAQSLAAMHWPGGLTLILPGHTDLPPSLLGRSSDGSPTIGVRWTAHPIARQLCLEAGPLVATSANFSGATGTAAAPDCLEAIPPELKALVDAVVDGGKVGGLASTVLDCTCDPPRVLRQGAVDVAWPSRR